MYIIYLFIVVIDDGVGGKFYINVLELFFVVILLFVK